MGIRCQNPGRGVQFSDAFDPKGKAAPTVTPDGLTTTSGVGATTAFNR